MKKPNGLRLSRRKVLAGLGTVGVAAAGAGLGTSAYFNDTESFKNNTITAGKLDLSVSYSSTVDQDGMGPDENANWVSGDLTDYSITMPFEISDLKPGDTYNFCWKITNDGNPAVVRALIPWDSVTNRDGMGKDYANGNDGTSAFGSRTRSDVESDLNTTLIPLLGSHNITVTNSYFALDGGTKKPLDDPHASGDQAYVVPYTSSGTESDSNQHDGGLGSWVTSVSDFKYSRQDGVPIGAHDNVGRQINGDLDQGTCDYILIGNTPNTDYDFTTVYYCIEIDVSTDAGNEIQGASTSFDLQFLAEQARHNPQPFSGLDTRPRGTLANPWHTI